MMPARRFPFGKTPPPLPAAQVPSAAQAQPAVQARPAAHADEITKPLPDLAAPTTPVLPAFQARTTMPLVEGALSARPALPFRPVAKVPETPARQEDRPALLEIVPARALRRWRALWMVVSLALALDVAVLGAFVASRPPAGAPAAAQPPAPATTVTMPTVLPAPVVSTTAAVPSAGATALATAGAAAPASAPALATAPRATGPRVPRPSTAARTARPVGDSDVRDPWGF